MALLRASATAIVLLAMSGPDGELVGSLRLAAKAADREAAAEDLWPTFEQRLRALGYDGRAIARAYRTLAGPGTVSEALAQLGPSRGNSAR